LQTTDSYPKHAVDDIERHKNWLEVLALADEALKRKLAAAKALDLGCGGISTVTRITGTSPTTIRKRIQELTWQSGQLNVKTHTLHPKWNYSL
jgi:DNA invertase Pin-like site-specific DNA recombinase